MISSILDTVRNNSGKIAVGLGGLAAYKYRKNLKRSFRNAKDYVLGEDESKADKKKAKKAARADREALAAEIVRFEQKALKKAMRQKKDAVKKEAKKAFEKAKKADKKAAKKAAKHAVLQPTAAPVAAPAFEASVVQALQAELAAAKAREEATRKSASEMIQDALAQVREANRGVVPQKKAAGKKLAAVK